MREELPTPPAIGIIANPASGKDVRRIVGAASVVDNNEKVNVVRRILSGLAAVGVDRVHYMPEHYDMVARALDGARLPLIGHPIEMGFAGRPADTLVATTRLADLGVGCIIVLGGDGTSRLVARRCGDIPIVAVSTGTNNALPSWIDGTIAGLAAGLVGLGRVDLERCAPRAKRLLLGLPDGGEDVALVDLAISRERFVGARAVWDPATLSELFLTRAEPGSMGLSAIGSHLCPVGREEPHGVWLSLGAGGGVVRAPIVPGMVRDIPVRGWRPLIAGHPVVVHAGGGVVALDGEKEHEVAPDERVVVTLSPDGPRIVEIRRAIDEAARAGVFRDGGISAWPSN